MDSSRQATRSGWCTPQTIDDPYDGPFDEPDEGSKRSPNPEGWWSQLIVKSSSSDLESSNAATETHEEDSDYLGLTGIRVDLQLTESEILRKQKHVLFGCTSTTNHNDNRRDSDYLELTDSQVDLQLTESQIWRMQQKQVSFGCTSTLNHNDNRTDSDHLELTDSQVDLQLTESQILRMQQKQVSFGCISPSYQNDNRREGKSRLSIMSLLKEHSCNYDLDSSTYRRLAQQLDTKIEQIDNSFFGPLPSQEETFDTDDVISPRSSGPLSPDASDANGSFTSMYEDLQEEMATGRQKNDDSRSTTLSKSNSILKSRSSKSEQHQIPSNADGVLKDNLTNRINDRSTLIATIPVPLNDDVVLKDNSTKRINKRSTLIVTKEPVMSEEGFEQEISFEREFEREFEESINESGEEVIGGEREVEVDIDEAAAMETAASTKDRPPEFVMINGSFSLSVESSHLETMSSISEDETFDPMRSGFQALNVGQSKSCVPPLFQKKLKMYGRLMLNKSMSTNATSKMTAESYPTMRMASKPSSGSEAEQKSTCYIYEYGSDKNAYIAYFRRAEVKARTSVRLYEHPIPPVFSTLSAEVVVKIEASSVSATDCAVRRGKYWGEGSHRALSLPIVPGVTFAGRIIQGDKLRRSGLNIGDRVMSLVRVGANSRHLCISKDRLVKVPAEISDPASACCLPELYLAAFQALHLGQNNSVRYRKTSLNGKSVLVLGGDTAHGLAAIELAVAGGATIVYGAGKENHFGKIREVGGFPVDRDPRTWFAMAEGKLDLIIGSNNVDHSRSELKHEHIRMLNQSGCLVLLTGPDEDEKAVIDLDKLDGSLPTKRKMLHHSVFDAWETDLRQGRRDLTHLLKLLESGSVKPRILERIPLTKVAKAQDMMENRNLRGFIVCEPWMKSTKRGAAFPGTDFYSESLNQSNSYETLKSKKEVTSLSFSHSLLHSSSHDSSTVKSKSKGSTNGPMANGSLAEGASWADRPAVKLRWTDRPATKQDGIF
jgi:NADPH:quinone reductase-like Zn-dependent oxidoreductase